MHHVDLHRDIRSLVDLSLELGRAVVVVAVIPRANSVLGCLTGRCELAFGRLVVLTVRIVFSSRDIRDILDRLRLCLGCCWSCWSCWNDFHVLRQF